MYKYFILQSTVEGNFPAQCPGTCTIDTSNTVPVVFAPDCAIQGFLLV